MTELSGRKFDEKKARYDLIPSEAIEALAELYALGANKYGDHNWLGGMKWGRIFAAMMRHAWAWFRGEKFDKEDGQHHLISVAWCALALFTYELEGIGLDDRRKRKAQETTTQQNSQGSSEERVQTESGAWEEGQSGWQTAKTTEA